jgi:nucleotide-binding universal stress UspA family protein
MSLSIVMVVDAPAPFHADAHVYVARLAERWQHHADNVTGQVVSDPLSPADGIRAHLDLHPAGLVAVTTHAREGLHRLRLGATAANIVRVSVAPTLVVPLT